MKLRTRSGSIRLRLTRSEVDAIAAVGVVEERVAFGPRDEDALTYALVASEAATAISARFLAGERRIVVEIPRGQARTWATDEQVGFETHQDGLASSSRRTSPASRRVPAPTTSTPSRTRTQASPTPRADARQAYVLTS